MTLRLLTAAVFATLAPCALAQSSVTLYGVVDPGLLVTNPRIGSSLTELADGIDSQSRFGLRGAEALGGGLTAVFTLEGGIAVDTGLSQQAGRLFGRQAWAGLRNAWGEVRLGRQYAAGYELFLPAIASPFRTTYRDAGTGAIYTSASGRMILDNMIEVRTVEFAGFSAIAGYSFAVAASEVAPSGNNLSAMTLGAMWRGGPAAAAVTYERFNCPDNTTAVLSSTCNGQSRSAQGALQIGGSYDFTLVKVYGMWGQDKDQFTLAAVTPSADSQSYTLGASAPVLGGTLLGIWQARDDKAYGADLSTWGFGYQYPLSRRTLVYGFFSDTTADKAPQVRLVSSGVVVRPGLTAAEVTSYLARDRQMLGVGLRHQF